MITTKGFKNFYRKKKKRFFMSNAFSMFLGVQKDMSVRFYIYKLYEMIKVAMTIFLLGINSQLLLYLNMVLTIYIDNMLMDAYKIVFFFVLVGGVIFLVGLKRLFYVIRKNVLFLNFILFFILFYFFWLDDEAYDSEILMFSSIGLYLLKTRWTQAQLQKFFEKFKKEIEYIFSDEEKKQLIKYSLDPTDLKEKMIEKAAAVHDVIPQVEDFFFYKTALLGCFFVGLAFFGAYVYFCMGSKVEVADIKTTVEVFTNATSESNGEILPLFSKFFEITTKIILEIFS